MRPKLPFIVRRISLLLTLILLIKIGGYFSIVEERSINQIFKTISRMGMTACLLWIYLRLLKMGCVYRCRYDNLLAPLLYLLYLALGLASVAWSTDPAYSTLQWLMTFESFVFVFVFMRIVQIVHHAFPPFRVDFVALFANAIFPIMLVFLAGAYLEPDTFYRGMRGGEEQRLGGWIMNPNELGMLASLGAATAFLRLSAVRRKFAPVAMMMASIVVLVLTSSRSSAIGFLLIIGLLVTMTGTKRMKRVMIIGSILSVPLMLNYVVFKDSGGVEEVMSMTGRLPFWKALLNEGIVKEPFFGYGFMRISYTDAFQGFNTYAGKMTHNTFIQVLLNLGFVGFFIAFWQVVTTVRNFVVERGHPHRLFFLAVFIPIIINSFTEFGVFGEANYGILFYQFLILLFVIKPASQHTRSEHLKIQRFHRRWDAALEAHQRSA